MIKGTACTIPILVWDFENNTGKTGQQANITLLAVGDITEFTPSAPNITEIDATNRKGEYYVSLTTAENNYDVMSVGGILTIAVSGCEIIPTRWVNESGDLTKITGKSIAGTGTQVPDAFKAMFDVSKPVFTAESVNQNADIKTVTDIISADKIAASMDAMSDIEFSNKMKTTLNALTPISVGKVTGNIDGSVNSVTKAVTITSNSDITGIKTQTDKLSFADSNVNSHIKATDNIDLTTLQKASVKANSVSQIVDGDLDVLEALKLSLALLKAKRVVKAGNIYYFYNQSDNQIAQMTIGTNETETILL